MNSNFTGFLEVLTGDIQHRREHSPQHKADSQHYQFDMCHLQGESINFKIMLNKLQYITDQQIAVTFLVKVIASQ
jgi:hypothetical protein